VGGAAKNQHAEDDHAEVLQQAWAPQELRDRAAETYEECLAALDEGLGPALVHKQFVGSFCDHVKAVEKLWVSLDTETMDPMSLGAVAQSMLTVAWLAHAIDSAMSDANDASPSGPLKRGAPLQRVTGTLVATRETSPCHQRGISHGHGQCATVIESRSADQHLGYRRPESHRI
jgi:hypothetical protein